MTIKNKLGALRAMKHWVCPKCSLAMHCNTGAYRSHEKHCGRDEEYFWRKVDKSGDCWLWTGFLNHDGYGRIGPKAGIRTGARAHKVAWEMANGPVPVGLCVMHVCDTRACVRLDHLKLGTHQENLLDMALKGRAGGRGEKSIHAKLTEEQVRLIRSLFVWTHSRKTNSAELAARFGVTRGTITQIIAGVRWKHVQ